MSTFELSDEVFNEILRLSGQYHREAERCRDAKAFLAGCVMIGAAFEAFLLAYANCYPEEAVSSKVAPRKEGTVRPLIDWSLASLLLVAKDENWLPSALSLDEDWDAARAQIGDYGEVIRQIRNLVHPARHAIDMPRKRITKRYLENVFEIMYAATDHLVYRLEESVREAMENDEIDV